MQETKFEIVPAKSALPAVEVLTGEVADDTEAIRVFINSYSRKSAHTVRSYGKECYRFLLWLKATRDPSPAMLPAVTVQDINDYLDFVANPRPFSESFLETHGWEHQPFRKALASESMKHCITVLYKMFSALRELRAAGNLPYCMFNPLKLAHDGISGGDQDDEIEEALTDPEWEAVQAVVEDLPRETERDVKHYHRARWVMQLLYRAFLRRAEAAKLKMGSFEASAEGWNIRFVGKGAKKAKIIATNKLIEELKVYRTSLGLPPLPSPGETRPAILAVTGKDKGLGDQAIYLLCKVLFDKAADRIEATDPVGAQRLRKATPHWMRHTGVTHALEAGANPRYVQAQARHSSLNVTAKYDHQERRAWRRDMEMM
jgi:site-specific recombinase XerD